MKKKKGKIVNTCEKQHSYFADNQGISLVALIITIIVMVILAGIIIVSAVADGGIIDRAKQALKEQECADVQEIIISSYVYEATATTGNSYAFIDLGKTAEAIFDNLTSNGFEIVGADSVDDFYTPGDTELDLEVKGEHGTYEGTVDKEGLQDDLIWQPEEDDIIGGATEPQKTDLEKLREYFVGEMILNSTNEGLVDTQKMKFKEKTGVLTQEEAESIIFTPLTTIPEVGKTADIPLEFNGELYILVVETIEKNSELQIVGKSVDISKPSSDDLELLRKCMKDKEIIEDVIGTEQTFSHEDGDEVTVRFEIMLFLNTETEFMVEILYNKAKYIVALELTENEEKCKIVDVNYVEKANKNFKYNEYYISDIPMAETYIGTYSQAAIKVNENGDMQLYCIDTMELFSEMTRAIKIYSDKMYVMEDDNIYMMMGTISEDGKSFTISIDGTTIIFTYGVIPDADTRVVGCYGLFGQDTSSSVTGTGVVINEDKTGFMYMALDDIRIFPLIELMAIEGSYEVNVNGSTKTITNPVFQVQQRQLIDKNPRMIKKLSGCILNGKFISINTEYDNSDSNIGDDDFIKVYKRVQYSSESIYPRIENKFYENLKCDKIYIQEDSTESGKNMIGFANRTFEVEDENGNKTTETRSVIYQGIDGEEVYGQRFWIYGPIEYEIKEDFVAQLEDGTTIDYSGKKVIFAEPVNESDFQGREGQYNLFGYFDGDEIVVLDTSTSERDENGFAIEFGKIEEAGRLKLD